MRIKRKTITNYFCIAPRSIVETFRSGKESLLDLLLDPKSGPSQWMEWVGAIPQMKAVVVADYEDGQRLVLSRALHKLGITAQPSDLIPSDPCIFLRVLKLGSMQVVLGFAYREPGQSIVTNGDGPASVS